MTFDFDTCHLSALFMTDYPSAAYPELMLKTGRPYTCLLIETHYDYFMVIPFRSNIRHKNAFLFKNTARSQKSQSGLDFSKMVLVKNPSYIDTANTVLIDKDEYIAVVKNINEIANLANTYLDTYINHITGHKILHPREFQRKYSYSTLPYFHDIINL